VESTQVKTEGQSESVVHVGTLGWQLPGKDVVVVHTGVDVVAPASNGVLKGGVADSPLPPPEPELAPPVVPCGTATPELAEHIVMTVGWHAKPLPQSASALHGSCHL
jgi:hypothetical protein